MKRIQEEALKILKKQVNREVNAERELSSRCFSFFYQPKRKKSN